MRAVGDSILTKRADERRMRPLALAKYGDADDAHVVGAAGPLGLQIE
jgi:hypothetical protein